MSKFPDERLFNRKETVSIRKNDYKRVVANGKLLIIENRQML